MHGCCYNDLLRSGKINADPTSEDTGYPTPYLGWTPEGKAFLHIGSGTWIALGATPENGNGNGNEYAPKFHKKTKK